VRGRSPAVTEVIPSALPGGMRAALQTLETEALGTEKGVPASFVGSLADIGRQGWTVYRGDVPLPLLVLRDGALRHNVDTISTYCSSHGAWLAAHGKTTMAPQLFARQLAGGAWAITVSNVPQLQVCRAFQVPRVLLANEVTDAYDLHYIARELKRDPSWELYLLVDSVIGVTRLAHALAEEDVLRPVPVLVEIGTHGGRCGVRTREEALQVANAVLAAPGLSFAGVEGFEGAVHGESDDDELRLVDQYLQNFRAIAVSLQDLYRLDGPPYIVSAGGTLYGDRVVAALGDVRLSDAQLVLRMGCYITHDSGWYDNHCAFGAQSPRHTTEPILQPAIEVWSAVLSRPEPELCILGMGRRDAPSDLRLPIPTLISTNGGAPSEVPRDFAVVDMNDQHTFLRVNSGSGIAPGDLVACGISHPCAAFERWRVIMLVDEQRQIVGAIKTFF
jgi:D-serine dehydratase